MGRRIAVRTTLAGWPVETTVDSDAARYYLERYLHGARDDPALDRRIDAVHAAAAGPLPSRERLRDLSRAFSTDFATAYLADRLLRDGRERPLRGRYERALAAARAGGTAAAPPLARDAAAYSFHFVPGFMYRSVRESGADLAGHRELIARRGIESHLIPIAESGTVEENAAHVARALADAAATGRRLVVISASTGGPSTALALAGLGADVRRRVAAWVNVGGLLQGSALADRAVRLPRRWIVGAVMRLRGWQYASIPSMTTERSRERLARAPVPRDVLCVNYVGVPFSGDVGARARADYRYLRAFGPNDGLTLITDALVPHGETIAVLGADHFHTDREASLRTDALTEAVLGHLDAAGDAAGDAAEPPAEPAAGPGSAG